MKKSYFWLILLFIFLTTYTPRANNLVNSNFNIKEIIIENNSIIDSKDIKKKLNFLYDKNLFLMNIEDIAKSLEEETLIESFSVKKVYPNSITL